MKKLIAAASLGIALAGSLGAALMPSAKAEAMPVFDASNYAQNILTAARTLQSVNQQIQQLQNEARMLTQLDKHLTKIDFPQLRELEARLQEIDRLMGEAQGIGFKTKEWQDQYRRLFPGSGGVGGSRQGRIENARQRLEAASEQFRQTMAVQSQIVANVHDDAEAMRAIAEKSQSSEGGLQAQQATNQLLALAAKQQFQIQHLLAAQFRSESIEHARRAQSERDGREQSRRFLGDGKAYTPR